MTRTSAVLLFVFAAACNRHIESPTAPVTGTQPAATNGSVAGFVVDSSNQCISGARVEMIDGPNAGAAMVQMTCAFWDYGEEAGNGYVFHNLPVGTRLTFRATAPGYKSAELQAIAGSTYSYDNNFKLAKEP